MLKSDANTKGWLKASLPYVLLCVPPLCWGGNIVLGRGVTDIIPPVSLAFWRWIVALVILLPFTWKHARQDWSAAMRSWKILLLLSLFGISWFNAMLYAAVRTTTAMNGALIQTAMPAFILLITLLLYREMVSKIQLAGVALCIGGACFVVLRGDWRVILDLSFVEGDLIMIVAVVFYASYSALLPKRPEIHPLSFLTYSIAFGILGLLPVYLAELALTESFEISAAVVFSILFVAVFPSIVAYLCWNRGIDMIGANRAGLFINLIPVFASILAILLLNESLQYYHVLGMICIFAGMVLFNR
jgi:drug/metabolite transporter (DMT)-like permease